MVDTSAIPTSFSPAAPDPHNVWQPNLLANFRAAYPQYSVEAGYTDPLLLDAIYQTYFSDSFSRQEFFEALRERSLLSTLDDIGGVQISALDHLLHEQLRRENREAYEQARASRPITEKIGDWANATAQGLLRGHGDELLGWMARVGVFGDDWGESPEDRERLVLEQVRGTEAEFAAEAPVLNTALQIAGAAIPYVAAGAPINVATQMPAWQQAPLWGAVGGIDAAMFGHGMENVGPLFSPERIEAAQEAGGLGTVIGEATPLVGGAVAPIARGLETATAPLRWGRNRAKGQIDESLGWGGQSRVDIAEAMGRSPELMPLDLDPSLTHLAQGIATQPGQGRQVLATALSDRVDRLADGVREIIAGRFGPAPNVRNLLRGIQERVQDVGARFDPILQSAGPIDVAPIVAAIDAQLPVGWRVSGVLTPEQQRLISVRQRLVSDTGEQLVYAETLHNLQSTIRSDIEALLGGASGQETRVGQALLPVRSAMIQVLDNATDGAYRPLQQAYATANSIQRAYDRGYEILNNPRSGAAAQFARPEFWEEWVAGLSDLELEAARLGALARMDTEIGTARNSVRRGIAIPEVDFNAQRLAILFGEDEVAALSQAMSDMRTMLTTTNQIMGGSQTAPRQRAVELSAVRKPGSSGIGLGTAAVGAGYAATQIPELGIAPAALLAGTAGVKSAAARFRGAQDRARNVAAAQMLTQQGPEGAATFSAGQMPPLLPTDRRLPTLIEPFLRGGFPPVLGGVNVPRR